MTIDDLARALIVLAIADWTWTLVLLIAAWRYQETALTERAGVGIICSLIASLFAVISANVLKIIELPQGTGFWLLTAAALLVSAPQFIWGIAALTGRFR